MTEAEWLACEDPDAMLNCVHDSASVRKLRLFCVACCRHLMYLAYFPEFVSALDAAESKADGAMSDAELSEARRRAERAAWEGRASGVGYSGIEHAVVQTAEWWLPTGYQPPIEAVLFVIKDARRVSSRNHHTRTFLSPELRLTGLPPSHHEIQDYIRASEEHTAAEDALDARLGAIEGRKQAALLRDIFGNPFRPVSFDPTWRTDTAVSLARTMYESREFGAMPILADALQDAGCEDEHILNHCRDSNQPHVRGCWVCDLVLGKT